jgi:transposase
VRQRTLLINAIPGHFGEFGIIAPAGGHRVALANLLQSADDADVPALAREALRSLFAELSAC